MAVPQQYNNRSRVPEGTTTIQEADEGSAEEILSGKREEEEEE